MRGIVISFVLSIEPCSSLKQDHAVSAAATAATLAHEMGHNFGMYHDDDGKSANNINREVYLIGCSCFNAFLNPNCRIVITLPNFTFQALLTCPHLIRKSIFHCLLFRPFAFWWRANLHRERDAWERRSLFHASMLHFCFVLLCI